MVLNSNISNGSFTESQGTRCKMSYLYNDSGQRTRKTVYQGDGISIDSITIYHYDQRGYLITETTETGALIKDYIWQQGLHPVAQIDASMPVQAGMPSEGIIYLHTDHLLTNRLATDATRKVIWRWEGEAFGNTPASGSVSVNLRFPGQYYDAETNLHYNHFRYYDPELGRYITSDPIGIIGGMNTYGYVNQNPIIGVDINGLTVSCSYDQASGQLICTNDSTGNQDVNEQCYSGAPGATNDPLQQNVPNVGPIPRGDYDIGTGVDNPKTGLQSLPLMPTPSNNQFPSTRDPNSFLMHGDNGKNNQSASEGCIICSLNTRNAIDAAGGGTLTVQ